MGSPSRLLKSTPLNACPTIDCNEIGVIIVPTITPAISENATGTPR